MTNKRVGVLKSSERPIDTPRQGGSRPHGSAADAAAKVALFQQGVGQIPSSREVQRRSDLAREARNRVIIRSAKDKPCADCGQKYPYFVMDFDHINGDKVANVATMATKRVKVEKLLVEIAKCEVVCANCHRARTHIRV